MTGFTPAHATVLRALRTVWPEDRFVVVGATAIGCHIDFRWRESMDLDLTVASAAAITILKMAASLDRPYRSKDPEDLAHLMDGIVGPDDAGRWSDPVLDLDLDFALVSPFVLGRRVAEIADDREKALVERFLNRLHDPSDRSASLATMIRMGPQGWREEEAALARLAAFTRGFRS